ncbi:MAG: hypothetical protein ACHQ50_14065 [Fimbriimonadales bacterium]
MFLALSLAVVLIQQKQPTSPATSLVKLLSDDCNRDLGGRESADRTQLKEAILHAMPQSMWKDFAFDWRFEPWDVWRTHWNEGPYIVFCGRPQPMNPGESRSAILVFSESGKYLEGANFSAGRSIRIESAREIGPWSFGLVIEVQCGTMVIGTGVSREFYCIDGIRPVLLRLEDTEGDRLSNPTYCLIGPKFPDHSPAEWLAQLSSESPTQALEALNWWEYFFDPQRNETVKPNEDWAKVGEAVKPLLHSKDRWIREAAESVQKGLARWIRWKTLGIWDGSVGAPLALFSTRLAICVGLPVPTQDTGLARNCPFEQLPATSEPCRRLVHYLYNPDRQDSICGCRCIPGTVVPKCPGSRCVQSSRREREMQAQPGPGQRLE